MKPEQVEILIHMADRTQNDTEFGVVIAVSSPLVCGGGPS